MKSNTNKHFTLEDRIHLLSCIIKGYSIRKTALHLNKAPSSISRELHKHRYFSKGFESEKCKHVRSCRKGPNCHLSCDNFELDICDKINRAPWICNPCDNFKHCRKNKYRYDPARAQKEYELLLVSAREGISLSDDDLDAINTILIDALKDKGQSIYHLFHRDDVHLPFSISSAYRYIDKNYLVVKNIDLPRRVRYRTHKKRTEQPVKPKSFTLNRTYVDFLDFIEKHSKVSIYEMDTVIGKREKGHKVLLTLLLRQSNFMLAFLLDDKTADSANNKFDEIEDIVSTAKFATLFYVGLTDNGSEFSNPDYLEAVDRKFKRTRIFYCNPIQSQQKGKIEKNHEYIRLFVPQGSLFDDFTQDDINLMMNHINLCETSSIRWQISV